MEIATQIFFSYSSWEPLYQASIALNTLHDQAHVRFPPELT